MQRYKGLVRVSAIGAMLSLGIALTAQAAEQPAAQSGVNYTSGGVGVDSQDRLNARAREFNLKLIFTLNEGNYIADVNVVLTDAKGNKVVEHVADGPFFMAKLPAGQYNVAATYGGKTVTRKVSVGGSGLRTEHFRWPSNPATDVPLSREQTQETRPAPRPERG
jgi:hypothetical protein